MPMGTRGSDLPGRGVGLPKLDWYKGNIHTHTTESDGDASPERVVSWYRRHGYDFLVLSDHNHLTLLDYGSGKRRFKRPLMRPGEEVSVSIQGGAIPIHVNGIGITRVVEPVDAGEVVPTLQANVDAIVAAGGIASINHPNYQWAFNQEAIRRVAGASLLEVFNAHPVVDTHGAAGRPSSEEIWDGVLSAGRVIFGVASDDSHNYKDFSSERSNPGRGWVMVRAPELTSEAIVEALANGQFYASTGVVLEEIERFRSPSRYGYSNNETSLTPRASWAGTGPCTMRPKALRPLTTYGAVRGTRGRSLRPPRAPRRGPSRCFCLRYRRSRLIWLTNGRFG